MKSIKNTIIASVAILLSACGGNSSNFDATGVFEATEVIVSAEASGKIMEFKLQEGQVLEPNLAIGYIDSTQLYLRKMQLLASQSAVKSRQTDIPRQIAALKQQIATQKSERARFQNLVKSNAANQKQVDDINAQILVLEKQLLAQTEVLTNTNRGITEESSSLEIQIAQLDDQIQKSIIKSPIQGTVLTKYGEQGELVQPGKALFKVADTENIFLRAYITSSQLTQIQLGQKVKVFGDFEETNSKEYAGVITWISDKAEFTPKTIQTRDERANLVYAIKIAVKNDGMLKLGMYGEVEL